MALNIVRFVNLLLATTLAGNAVGSVVFVDPAPSTLITSSHAEAERAITRRYLPIMRVLMGPRGEAARGQASLRQSTATPGRPPDFIQRTLP